jgi:hypothetical protein
LKRWRAGFDPPVIPIDRLRGNAVRPGWIVEKQPDIVMQRRLISFQRQGIIAALIDDLLRDGTLAIKRIDQRRHVKP